ncbi:hypothetical protein EYF80_020857 [Liparis tanakae]|uniref:Uncharacterized protein n=1 Tax=Liparis tanakae TaxID=230148 RepID=A0A4Z2HT09_9TELE|nr:hypothetical protein EYF80_020857 [Liparis tanakae]
MYLSTEEAGAVSQVDLRSHSDNRLASASCPGRGVQSLGGMAGHLIRQSGGWRFLGIDVVGVGHRRGASLIRVPRKGGEGGGHFLFRNPRVMPARTDERSSPRRRHDGCSEDGAFLTH